jgi:hypothetical protein
MLSALTEHVAVGAFQTKMQKIVSSLWSQLTSPYLMNDCESDQGGAALAPDRGDGHTDDLAPDPVPDCESDQGGAALAPDRGDGHTDDRAPEMVPCLFIWYRSPC